MGYTFKKGSLFAKVDGELQDINVLVGNVGGGSSEEITDAQKAYWSGKQDAISDLAAIRAGAAKGATALQSHQSLAAYATKAYVDDINNNILSMTDEEVGEIIG